MRREKLVPYRRDLVWALLLCAAVLGARYLPSPAEHGSDTWSARPEGKKLFFSLARRLFADVRRQTASLLPAGDTSTLCILGPERYPDAAGWRGLHAWVSAGHTLVFAARQEDPAVSLAPFGLRVRSGSGRRSSLELDAALAPDFARRIPWEEGARIEGAATGAWVPVRSAGRPLVVFQKVGAGTLVVLASDEFFENAWIASRSRGLLAVRILERARHAGGAVAIDESLSASGPPRVFGVLLSPALRPVTFQLLGLFILIGWAGSRTFGAALGGERPARRQITEHALALGQFHRRTSTGGTPVASYLEYFRHELGLGRHGALSADAIARQARVDPTSVRSALEHASRAIGAARVQGREASAAVRALAEIRNRAGHRRSR
jgi:hypothetical protein